MINKLIFGLFIFNVIFERIFVIVMYGIKYWDDVFSTNAKNKNKQTYFIQQKNYQQQPVKKVKSTDEIINELEDYKSLLDDGIITQEEFDEKKKELLNSR